MIQIIVVPNVFEAHERQAIAAAYVYGQTARSYLPPHLTSTQYALFRNGKLLQPGEDPVLLFGVTQILARD